MEFSRAMLAASASVLGLLLYIVAGLLVILAIVGWFRADPAGPSSTSALVVAVLFTAAGFGCRLAARKIA